MEIKEIIKTRNPKKRQHCLIIARLHFIHLDIKLLFRDLFYQFSWTSAKNKLSSLLPKNDFKFFIWSNGTTFTFNNFTCGFLRACSKLLRKYYSCCFGREEFAQEIRQRFRELSKMTTNFGISSCNLQFKSFVDMCGFVAWRFAFNFTFTPLKIVS